jgi:hypothetical protein
MSEKEIKDDVIRLLVDDKKILKQQVEDILKAYKDQQLYKHITSVYKELDKK